MIRLAAPTLRFNEIKSDLRRIITSGQLTKGVMIESFEKTICKFIHTKYAIAVNSGTSALHIALLALGVGKGDEVLVPAFTFPATANVVENCGAKSVLVDIDLNSFNISIVDMKQKISHKTKAIIIVHQFGTPVDMEPIIKIAKDKNIKLIEDAACALGAKYKNKMCGSLSDVGCFSFHPRKIVTTGEGGVITTNSPKIAKVCRQLRNHGIRMSGNRVLFESVGYNYRLTEISACMGISQMKKIKEIIKKRRQIAKKLNTFFEGNDFFSLPTFFKDRLQVFQSYIILLKSRINRDQLMGELYKDKIETTIGNYALHVQPYFKKKYHYHSTDLPHAYLAYKNSLALPLHAGLTVAQVNRLEKNVIAACRRLV
ncbi:MAG: hypothetical protein A3B70_06060 [Deltaproteobacteria bacterium RIFCSPHIGHO2_02_FULL_40_11]|nr:MAG: hypothetical protein A3B70_06060 [Deltaproteobacteria bacterium RIFCSPHIGHO2_02_FULL_40_11]